MATKKISLRMADAKREGSENVGLLLNEVGALKTKDTK